MSTIPSQVEINFNKIHQRSNSSSSTSSYRIPSGNSCIPRTVEMPSLPPTSTHHQHQQMPSSSSHAHIAKKIHREVRFGAYILGSTLGEGEFGKVKLGWRKDGKHPSQVAIKLIKRSTITKDSDSEIKIHREINSLKLLNHPNIVNLVEVMKSGKYIGIVLEYASGGELFDYILQHKYLKENVAKKLFAQLVSGVDYMHAKGLIHRDLKLENLLLDKHRNVIISDFGFVNSYNRDKNDLMKTSCGSPCYAAPELVLSQTAYEGRKVDIWSLGVILYAMLAGYLPFDDDPENEDGSDIIKLYHYICKTPLTFPEYVSPLARDLLRKIIVSDPKKRISIDDIRNHPWLSSHANLLSIRQPEWDKVHSEKQQPIAVEPPQPNKRYSMINERTNSSSLMSPAPRVTHTQPLSSHARSYSSTSISLLYSSPSATPSWHMAVTNGEGATTTTTNGSINESNDTLQLSGTPSPKKPSTVSPVRGHQKSASISNSYSSASIALKAVVHEENRLHNHQQLQQYIPRSSTISTIVESPTKANTATETETTDGHKILLPPPSKDAQKLPHAAKKPRPTSYHPSSMSSALIHNNQNPTDVLKMPSPINFPMTQFISTSPPKSNGSLNDSGNFTNCSPKATSRRNSVVTHVHVNGVLSKENLIHSSSSPDNKRNSVLSYLEDKIDTLELTESHSPSKNTFEEIVDAAIATPEINQVPVFDSQTSPNGIGLDIKHKEFDETSLVVEKKSKETVSDSKSEELTKETQQQENVVMYEPIVPVEEYIKKPEEVNSVEAKQPEEVKSEDKSLQGQKSQQQQQQPEKHSADIGKTKVDLKKSASQKKKVKEESIKKQKDVDSKPIERRHTIAARRHHNDENKENKDVKKRNRFSLLSFYSSYNSSNSNVSLATSKVPSNSENNTTVLKPTSMNTTRKVLEPSNETNIMRKETKQTNSNGSTTSKSTTSSSSSSAPAASSSSSSSTSKRASTATKETSAARKVMDFFKRRSVRVG